MLSHITLCFATRNESAMVNSKNLRYCIIVLHCSAWSKYLSEFGLHVVRLTYIDIMIDGLIFMGYPFSWFSWRVWSTNSWQVLTDLWLSVWIMKENTMATNFWPHKWVIFCQSTTIGTHENKASTFKCLQSERPDSIVGLSATLVSER